jgi:transcriptional regulator with XRE-family HTH domain
MIAPMPWDSFLLDWDDDLTARGFAALGALVRRRRRQLRITQRELEWLSGIDQTLISKLENGRLKGMRWSRFGRLVGALGGLAEDDPEPEWRQRGGRSGIEGARWRPRAISLEADDEDDEDDEDDADGEDDETDKADKADTEGARTRMIIVRM